MGAALPVVAALRAFHPERALLHEEEDTRPYECDGLTAYRQLPMVVALPETEEQVRQILKTCSALGVPVVPRGAGTGLSGGALPATAYCFPWRNSCACGASTRLHA